jgi:hypothetical protein
MDLRVPIEIEVEVEIERDLIYSRVARNLLCKVQSAACQYRRDNASLHIQRDRGTNLAKSPLISGLDSCMIARETSLLPSTEQYPTSTIAARRPLWRVCGP